MNPSKRLHVVVATPLPEELCELIVRLEPRVDLIRDQYLLPPQRWAADYEGDPAFRRSAADQARFEAMIDSAEALYGIPDVKPAALARAVRANPRLKWVQIMAAGGGSQVKAAGLDSSQLERVVFTTGAGAHAGPLSEFALFALFAGAKRLPRLTRDKAAKQWGGRWPMAQVAGQTVVVAGLGHIGRTIAAKLAALGATVVGVDLLAEQADGVRRIYRPDRLAEAAAGADALVNALPGTDSTQGLIDAPVLAALKPGATIASVGRGTAFDEPALIQALISGQVGFVGLDVFAVEPLPSTSPLWEMPNVLISPHTAANADTEERFIAELFADNARRFLDGEPLRNRVNTVEFF